MGDRAVVGNGDHLTLHVEVLPRLVQQVPKRRANRGGGRVVFAEVDHDYPFGPDSRPLKGPEAVGETVRVVLGEHDHRGRRTWLLTGLGAGPNFLQWA